MVSKQAILVVMLGVVVLVLGFADAQGVLVHSGDDVPGNALTITSGAGNVVLIGNDSDINPSGTSSITWEFWIKPTEDAKGSGVNRIVATKWDGSKGIVVLVSGDGSRALLVVGVNRVPDINQGDTGIDGSAGGLTLNSWQHVAIRYINAVGTASDKLTVYKNGVQTSSKTVTNSGSVDNTSGLALGDDPSQTVKSPDTALGCQLDEFRVWAATNTNGGSRDQGEIQSSLHLAEDLFVNGDTLGAHYAFNGNLNDSESKTSVTSSAGITFSTASTAPIGKSVSKDVSANGLVSLDNGGSIDTDLDLNVTVVSASIQLTVARIPAPLPNLPYDTTNISSVQYWTVSHEGSNGNPATDAVNLTADVRINLAKEAGVGNPDDLRLLEASYTIGVDSFHDVSNADDAQTGPSQAVFTGVTVFTASAPHLVDVWALGGEADNPLPVELMTFNAQARDGQVVLEWSTASEFRNLGFNVYRSDSPNGPFAKLNSVALQGVVTSGTGKSYTWVDEGISPSDEVYYYYVEDVSFAGVVNSSRIVPVHIRRGLQTQQTTLAPAETALLQNYPNAFNPDTWIPFQLSEPAEVTLFIYDVTGTLIRTIQFGQRVPGYYLDKSRAIHWDGRNARGEQVGSGIYYCTLTAGEFMATQRMILLK